MGLRSSCSGVSITGNVVKISSSSSSSLIACKFDMVESLGTTSNELIDSELTDGMLECLLALGETSVGGRR